MSDAPSNLTEVGAATLERLRQAIANNRLKTPLTRTSLVGFGIRHQLDVLSASLSGHSRLACIAIVDVALAERRKYDRPSPELVWTGPEGGSPTARDTSVVLRELFQSATDHVILAGYTFTHAQSVLAPLYEVMRDREVRATFFVNFDQPKRATEPPEAYAEEQISRFARRNWPFGAPYPELYYDVRAIRPPKPYSIMHAKCVVIDGKRAFISSANFTMQGQEQNIEVGVLLDDARFAEHLARQWMGLVQAGKVGRVEIG